MINSITFSQITHVIQSTHETILFGVLVLLHYLKLLTELFKTKCYLLLCLQILDNCVH
uniref:Predicted otein n=1 Tax=Otarine gammaherpesvirus 4 TaxID=2801541 RepID=A0A889IWQ5_9GAMA|nr:Predicted otein [Otarine gammaherpesvirus 4]